MSDSPEHPETPETPEPVAVSPLQSDDPLVRSRFALGDLSDRLRGMERLTVTAVEAMISHALEAFHEKAAVPVVGPVVETEVVGAKVSSRPGDHVVDAAHPLDATHPDSPDYVAPGGESTAGMSDEQIAEINRNRVTRGLPPVGDGTHTNPWVAEPQPAEPGSSPVEPASPVEPNFFGEPQPVAEGAAPRVGGGVEPVA